MLATSYNKGSMFKLIRSPFKGLTVNTLGTFYTGHFLTKMPIKPYSTNEKLGLKESYKTTTITTL